MFLALLSITLAVGGSGAQNHAPRPGPCKQDVSLGSLTGDDTELQPVEGGSSVSLLTILVLACHCLSCPVLCVEL